MYLTTYYSLQTLFCLSKPLMFVYPYYTAAVIYLGLETYVKCANDQKRFEECKDLAICAVDTPEIRSLITSFFPASFITFGTFPESELSLKNETAGCNVLVSDTYRIYGSNAGLQDDINSGTYVISDNHISRNLLSSVVRWSGESDDAVWIDIVEASRHAALRGNQVGLGKDESKCPMTSTAESEIAKSEIEGEINFFNGPYCVGNQMEEFQTHLGSIALSAYGIGGNVFFPTIDAPNFGSLECDDCEDVLKDGRLKQITERGLINCAVFLDPARNLTMTSFLTLVNVQFCKIMSVAIFQGDSDAVNISYIDKMDYSSFPQEYDIVAGVSWETRVGFNTGNLGTMDMSLPYFTHDKHIQYNGTTYDGIGEAKGFAVDVAEETLMEIAQSAVTATVYAQRNGISRSTYFDMPLMHLLGDSLTFMMRDVIMYAGNYDDIINEAFTSSDQETEIGWNIVIANYGPAPKSPIFFCDYFSNCPPCQWLDNEGYSVCIGILP